MNSLRQSRSVLPANSETFVQMDGEKVQIDVYKSPEILEALKNNNIHICKSPASTTEILQPCDAGNCFKAAKSVCRQLHDEDVANDLLSIKMLENMMGLHLQKYPPPTNKRSKASLNKHKTIYGILRIRLSWNKTLSSQMIIDSFTKTGVYPYNPDVIFGLCKEPFSLDEVNQIKGLLPNLTEIFSNQGEISDNNFQQLQILGTTKTNVDNLIVTRRRSAELTNSNFLMNEANKAKRKQDAELARKQKKQRITEITATAEV